MPESNNADLAQTLRDALYVGVGLGVIGFQKVQVRRQELTKAIKSQIGDARGSLDKLDTDVIREARTQVEKLADGFEDRVKVIEERVDAVESQVDQVLDQLQDKLPEQARELVKQARDTAKQARESAKEARSQVRNLVRSAA